MVQEAKKHQAEDEKRRGLVDARNAGDTIAYQAEKTLNELGDKVPADDRQKIESQITDLREAIKGEDLSRIKSLTEQVQQASYALGQQMQAEQQQAGGAGPSNGGDGGPGEPEGDVVEGEFREA
jgi:molecular chaperone DnaK